MKKIIITGCSNGFGLLTAKHLAKQGHTVYATMRNVSTKNHEAAEQLRSWAKDNNADLIVTEMDVTSDASVEKAVAEIALHSGGQIDVVVNNAGFGTLGLVEEFSNEQLIDVFQTMVFGPNRLIKAALPYMHKHHSGLLILVSSRSSAFQIPFSGTYCASEQRDLTYLVGVGDLESPINEINKLSANISKALMKKIGI